MENVRKPAVAGMFYPGSESELTMQVKEILDNTANVKKVGDLAGIVAPHAGYAYSGITAGYAYNLLRQKNIETVVIISPSHREYFNGICIYDGDAYSTPLGEVPVNRELREKLITNSDYIFPGKKGHRYEHAIEVHIPFLQKVLNDFSIVPIIMGDQHKRFVDNLAENLARFSDDKTVILASSDLSHFYSSETADKMDTLIEKHISSVDYEGLLADLKSGRCEACGGGPIAVLLRTAELKNRKSASVLHRSDSGDVTGDRAEVVGYLSAAVYGE